MDPVTRKVHVRVPATSANLGSGFDTVGLALDYHDELEFTLSSDPLNMAAQILITGEGAMTKDLIEVADVDFNNVNITSIIVVFVIIAIVFRSASVPVLLVAAIESAIMINLGIPYFTGTTLPFITSIVIGTIQLGATVDYAILMTTRFREERNAGHTAKEAAQIAVEQCSQSILTSGLTFFAATFSVSLVSRMELNGVLCKHISRGALISMAVILLVLPSLLVITEPILRKTTFHWLKKPEITEKKA